MCKKDVTANNCSPEEVLLVNYQGDDDTTSFTIEAQTYIIQFDFKGDIIFLQQRARYDGYLQFTEIYFEGTNTDLYISNSGKTSTLDNRLVNMSRCQDVRTISNTEVLVYNRSEYN